MDDNKKENKFKTRKFQILAYPESAPQLIETLKELGWDFIGILHDKDLDKTGQLKKQHWHLYLSFSNPCYNTSIAKQIGLPLNLIRKMEPSNEIKYLAYLTHFHSKDKFHYDDSELISSSDKMLELVFNARNVLDTQIMSESQKVTYLLKLIDELGIDTMTRLIEVACYNELYDVVRRAGSIFHQIIKEKSRQD